MVSLRSSRLAAAVVVLSASSAMATVNTTKPVLDAGLSLPALTSTQFGCYGSSQGMTWAGNYNYMTSSICQIYCINLDLPAMGTSAGTDCYCGATAPPLAAKLDSSKCTSNCTGYGLEMCGGSNSTGGGVILSIWNDQLESSISNDADALTSSSSSSASATAAATTKASASTTSAAVVTVTNASGSVVTVVASETAAASSGSGTSKAGVAAGVVVGVIVVLAIGGGVWFFMRQKRRREVEEEHKRQVAANSFIASGKPGSSGGNSIPDTRLDPAILRDRRMSDGSIMDNQDYSRRILKVTNA